MYLFQLSTTICTFARRSEKIRVFAPDTYAGQDRKGESGAKHRVFGNRKLSIDPSFESVDSRHACVLFIPASTLSLCLFV